MLIFVLKHYLLLKAHSFPRVTLSKNFSLLVTDNVCGQISEHIFEPNGSYVWVIDQVWGQDGWILAKYFFACLWTETKSRSINSQKKNEANIHLERTNLVNKGFIIWLSGTFFMLNTAGSHEQARWLHLARSGSKSHRVIWFILPARGASHIIRLDIGHAFLRVCGPRQK